MRQDQWARWNYALAGNKLDMGARGNPPSGYYRRNAGKKGWEAICVYRDEDGTLCCIRNIVGDGSDMDAEQIDEMFASEIYAVPYNVYVAVAEEGQSWPPEYTTRLKLSEVKAGVAMTPELGRARLGMDLKQDPVSQNSASDDVEKREEPAPDWDQHVNAYRAKLLQTSTHDEALACFKVHDANGLPRADRDRMEVMLDTHRWSLSDAEARSANPRAVIGDNNPPEEAALDPITATPETPKSADEQLAAENSAMAAGVKVWLAEIGGSPRSQAEADKLADYATTFQRFKKSAEDQHKSEKAPLLQASRMVDDKWFRIRDNAENARKRCLQIANDWIEAETARRVEAAKKANEEAAAKSDSPASAPAPVEPEKVSVGNIRTVSQRSRDVFTVVDPVAYGTWLLGQKNINADLLEILGKLAQRGGAAGVDQPGVIKEQKRSAA